MAGLTTEALRTQRKTTAVNHEKHETHEKTSKAVFVPFVLLVVPKPFSVSSVAPWLIPE